MRWRIELLGVLLAAGCGGSARPEAGRVTGESSTGDEAPPRSAGAVPAIQVAHDSQPRAGVMQQHTDVDQVAPSSSAERAPALSSDPVWLNGEQLGAPELRELEAVLGGAPAPGRYWYDPHSGLWGLEEHGAGGVTRAGLRVPAPLSAAASHGASGAFVNDRELTAHELALLAQLLGWPPPAAGELRGRYVLDEQGRLYSIHGRYLGSVSETAPRALATSTSPAPCAWLRLGSPPDVLGRDVTINCD